MPRSGLAGSSIVGAMARPLPGMWWSPCGGVVVASLGAYWATLVVALRGMQSHLPDQVQVVGGTFEGFAELWGGNFDETVRALG